MGLTKKCELMYYINWGLAVCANFNLNTVGEGSPLPHNQTHEIVLFEKNERAVKPSPSPAGKGDRREAVAPNGCGG